MKKTPALLASFGITALIGILMLLIGGSALQNKSASAAAQAETGAAAAQVAQLEANIAEYDQRIAEYDQRIAEYQAREAQLQSSLEQSQQQTDQTAGQLQEYQQLVGALQQMGVITIDSRGQVFVSRGDSNISRDIDHDDDDD